MSLAEMLQAKKSSLKPTVTIVRPMPVIQTGLEDQGLSCLGGEIEPEHSEDEAATEAAARTCAGALRRAKHAVVYTGAGVSTNTGISDYRGPNGVWTSLATGRIPEDSFDTSSASPSFTHMCILKLMESGYVKFCTSTNLDGLHYKSGLRPLENLAELHGSIFCERCDSCGTDFYRSFPIRRTRTRFTGRRCADCGGSLTDSGIDFGQGLPERHLSLADEHAKLSDFSLVLGSSMRVRPASELPVRGRHVTEGRLLGAGKAALCIVNRMDTGLDDRAGVRSYGDLDLFMLHLARELQLEVGTPPDFSHLHSKTEMRKLATRFIPPPTGHYLGSEMKEKQVAEALFQVEAEMVAGVLAQTAS